MVVSNNSGGDKNKMFEDKQAKINKDIQQVEAKIKHLHGKRDTCELRIEQSKRDIDELNSKIQQQENKVEKEGANLLRAADSKIQKSAENLKNLQAELLKVQSEKLKAN